MDPLEPPDSAEPKPPPESWSYLPVNQEPFPDRTNVERIENVLSFLVGASFAAPLAFGLFVLTVHGNRVFGLDWSTAAWIFIALSALGGGLLLARLEPTLRSKGDDERS